MSIEEKKDSSIGPVSEETLGQSSLRIVYKGVNIPSMSIECSEDRLAVWATVKPAPGVRYVSRSVVLPEELIAEHFSDIVSLILKDACEQYIRSLTNKGEQQ